MDTPFRSAAPARRWCSAWLETSITAARQPDSTIVASVRESSIAGGVVSVAGATSRPSSICTVPMSPQRPFASVSR